MSSTKFVFSGPIGKNKIAARPLIGWLTFDLSETAEPEFNEHDRKQNPQRVKKGD